MTGRKGRTGAPAVVIFQHAAEEPAGILEPLLVGLGANVSSVRLFETNELPPVAATHVIFLGGPMSVNDEREFQCLSQEKALIRAAVKARRPVLGICLGAQLIASACGARVYPCIQEIGWRMVRGVGLAAGNPFAGFPTGSRSSAPGETSIPSAPGCSRGRRCASPGIWNRTGDRPPVPPRAHAGTHRDMDERPACRGAAGDPERLGGVSPREQPALRGSGPAIPHGMIQDTGLSPPCNS